MKPPIGCKGAPYNGKLLCTATPCVMRASAHPCGCDGTQRSHLVHASTLSIGQAPRLFVKIIIALLGCASTSRCEACAYSTMCMSNDAYCAPQSDRVKSPNKAPIHTAMTKNVLSCGKPRLHSGYRSTRAGVPQHLPGSCQPHLASAALAVNGFSLSTCLPACRAFLVHSPCRPLGNAT